MRTALPLALSLAVLACQDSEYKVDNNPQTTPQTTGTGTGATGTGTGNVSTTAPVANDDAVLCLEGGLVDFAPLDNDTDPNDAIDPATVAVVQAPAAGVVDIAPGGMMRYTHDGSEGASDSFTYTVDDVTGETSNIATVTVTIDPVNDPPEAIDDAVSVDEGSAGLFFVAANDTDPDSAIDQASIVITSPAASGSLTVNPNGTVDYVHDGSEAPTDSFRYTIADTAGAVSNPAIVTITVNPINDPPIANDDVGTVPPGTQQVLNLALNDFDPDDGLDLTSIWITANPANGTVVVNPDGTVDYTHDGGGSLTDSFSYTIQDIAGATSNIAQVDLTIDVVVPGVCTAPAIEVSTAPAGGMMLCDDPTDSTCEQDFGTLCPASWHLCTMDEFNQRNTGWTMPTSTVERALGVIFCRQPTTAAGHFTVPDAGSPNTDLGQDEIFNCYYGSSAPSCSAWYGCNEQGAMALCCQGAPSCGNGVVDSPEEQCDDGNLDDADDCLSSCAWRVPTAHGFSGTNCP